MKAMVDNNVFKKIDIYDLQYLCEEIVEVSDSANILLNVSNRLDNKRLFVYYVTQKSKRNLYGFHIPSKQINLRTVLCCVIYG